MLHLCQWNWWITLFQYCGCLFIFRSKTFAMATPNKRRKVRAYNGIISIPWSIKLDQNEVNVDSFGEIGVIQHYDITRIIFFICKSKEHQTGQEEQRTNHLPPPFFYQKQKPTVLYTITRVNRDTLTNQIAPRSDDVI